MSIFEWTDPDEGTVYQLMYNVTHTDIEGREHVSWRVRGMTSWVELPPFADVPPEAYEFWHGTVVNAKRQLHLNHATDDANDLLGAAYRLVKDLKALGILPEHFRAVID